MNYISFIGQRYLEAILKTTKQKAAGKKLILFGAGRRGFEALIYFLSDMEISYCCDNDKSKWGLDFCGVTVYPPEKLKEENPNEIFVLITSIYWGEISRQLDEIGIDWLTTDYSNDRVACHIIDSNKEKIDEVLEMLYDDVSKNVYAGIIEKRKRRIDIRGVYTGLYTGGRQYYKNDIFDNCISDDEVYVDAGMLNTRTLEHFIEFTNNRYEMIYGFEPDPISFNEIMSKFIVLPDRIKILPYALSDKSGEAVFRSSGGKGVSFINSFGNSIVKTTTIDEIIKGKVTFIKMDIEGGEQQALKGANKKIIKYRPKLAISIYHNVEDLWEIPLFIKALVPEYKISIRHSGLASSETVLYARI